MTFVRSKIKSVLSTFCPPRKRGVFIYKGGLLAAGVYSASKGGGGVIVYNIL